MVFSVTLRKSYSDYIRLMDSKYRQYVPAGTIEQIKKDAQNSYNKYINNIEAAVITEYKKLTYKIFSLYCTHTLCYNGFQNNKLF